MAYANRVLSAVQLQHLIANKISSIFSLPGSVMHSRMYSCKHSEQVALQQYVRQVHTAHLAGLLDGHVEVVLEYPICKTEGPCSKAACFGCLHHLLKPHHLLRMRSRPSVQPEERMPMWEIPSVCLSVIYSPQLEDSSDR